MFAKHWPAGILLPLRPRSLTHKNPQRRKIICGMRPVGGNDRSIDRSEDVFVQYNICDCCGCSCGLC